MGSLLLKLNWVKSPNRDNEICVDVFRATIVSVNDEGGGKALKRRVI